MISPVMLKIRNDSIGLGDFMSPRGNRLHRGIDLVTSAGHPVLSPCEGIITRIGICYESNPEYKLIVISERWFTHKILYIKPIKSIKTGQHVNVGDQIAIAMDISKKYGDKMITHIHWEVMLRSVLIGKRHPLTDAARVDPRITINNAGTAKLKLNKEAMKDVIAKQKTCLSPSAQRLAERALKIIGTIFIKRREK